MPLPRVLLPSSPSSSWAPLPSVRGCMTEEDPNGPPSAMMGPSLAAAKQQLRSSMKQKLATVSQESVASQSSTVLGSLLNFRPYVEARRVSIFLSMPAGEVQTDAIVRHALAAGKRVFVPYLHRSPSLSPDTPSRVMDMVELRDLPDYESLQRDRWGIPSIDPATVHERCRILGGPDAHHSAQSTLDLVLMPGVAFDLDPDSGLVRRCGHGRGFYDLFIGRYTAKLAALVPDGAASLLLYGLALSEQFMPSPSENSVPIGPFDRPLDGVILGDGDIKMSPPNQID